MKRLLSLIAFTCLTLAGAAHAQTEPPPPDLVWSTLGSCENGNARNNCGTGTTAQAWRPAADLPLLVAVYRNAAANCGTRWWDQNVSIQWTKPANVNADWCVAYKPTGSTNENLWKKGSALTTKYPPATNPTPVPCVGAWGNWTPVTDWSSCQAGKQTRTEQQVYTVTTPASGGGAACPFANGAVQTRTAEQDCAMPGPEIDPPTFTREDGQPFTGYVYTHDVVVIHWTSRFAEQCTGSWTPAGEQIPTSGSARISYPLPIANAWQSINCVNAYGAYGTTAGFTVLSRTPDCYPNQDREGDSDKVAVKAISLANATLRYQIMATWFCRVDGQPVQQRYVLGVKDGLEKARQWLRKQFNETDVRAQCEAGCEVLQPGPLKTELDTWAAEFTAAQLGVIGE